MPENATPLSLRLASGQQVDAFAVKLADGSIVLRTAAELRKVPNVPRAPIAPAHTP